MQLEKGMSTMKIKRLIIIICLIIIVIVGICIFKDYENSKRHIFYDQTSVRTLRDDVIESYKLIEQHLGKQELKVFAYPYGAYTKETVRTLKNNGIDMQIYDIGINNFKTLDKNYIKRINIPCEMTGCEIIQEIESGEY